MYLFIYYSNEWHEEHDDDGANVSARRCTHIQNDSPASCVSSAYVSDIWCFARCTSTELITS